jgi:hypothetical protein
MGWATVWVSFLQTHLVTLPTNAPLLARDDCIKKAFDRRMQIFQIKKFKFLIYSVHAIGYLLSLNTYNNNAFIVLYLFEMCDRLKVCTPINMYQQLCTYVGTNVYICTLKYAPANLYVQICT